MPSGSSDATGVQTASSPSPAFAGSSGQFPPFSPSTAESESGPSIPFNANQPAQPAESTAIDDLISAGGEFGSLAAASNPAENQPAFPTVGSSTPNADGRSDDLGLLASRTVPEAKPGNDPNSTPSPESLMPFTTARTQALEMAQLGKLAEALEFLSPYYESPELGYTEHTDLVDILDALAREVIYSDRSLIYPKHTVSAQDTLEALAAKQRINVELLAAINKMGESQALLANTEIKLIEGPFRAQVSLSRGELTLFLRKLYAGRFPVSISQQNKPPLGNYEIVDRRKDRTFYGANSVIPAGAPTNPYGGYWLSLGGNLSIHGSPEQVTTDLEGAGCISLAPLDAADVYRILSKGASVEVRP
jgi:lipoprotein-anchoring transpeptidase ErfK/SrfK